jgi:S-methylmethionine-dependent homocysteine/selenocysteine methylase
MPYIISFMIRDDGRLLDGTTIHEAIQTIDSSVDVQAACSMTDCVHPTAHLDEIARRLRQRR